MTGLFADLSRRFAAGGTPDIRPRPQAKYEGSTEADLVEEFGEIPATIAPMRDTSSGPDPRPIAARPPVVVPIVAGPDPRRPDPVPPIAPQRHDVPEPESAAPPASSVEMPAPIITRQIVTETAALTEIATTTTIRQDSPAPQQVRPQPAEDAGQPPQHTTPEHIAPPVLQTRTPQPERQHDRQDTRHDQRESSAPTIRIGSITLRQPAAPHPPQPTPVRVAAPPARAPSHLGHNRTQGSGLTDYLGWKK